MIKYKAKNSLKSPRFAGVKTFMRMEHVVTTDDIDFAVVGIPYDTCASFRVGTRLGPAAIRDASALAAKPFNGPLNVGIFDWCSGVDYGDLGSVPGYIEESFELITEGMLPFFEKGDCASGHGRRPQRHPARAAGLRQGKRPCGADPL